MKKHISLFIALSLAILFSWRCKNPSEDLVVIINTANLYKSPFMVQFDDASALADFEVKITGKDSALVQWGTGGNGFKVVGGMLALSLKKAANPTPENPLVFMINADIPGYNPVKKTVVISGDASSVIVIPISRYVKPVDGTAEITIETLLQSGSTTSITSFSTPTNAKLAEKVSLTIPSGTQMQSSPSTKIDANLLTSKLTFYGTSATSLNAILPGYTGALNALDENGQRLYGGVNFTTAGLVRLSMIAGSTTVRNLSKPIELTQEISTGITNPITQSTLKAGDNIPIWILDASGVYKKTTLVATVSAGSGGKLVAKYTLTSPGTYNLAWGKANPVSQINKTLEINFLPIIQPWTNTSTFRTSIQDAKGIILNEITGYQPQRDWFRIGTLVAGNITYTTETGKYGYRIPLVPNISSAKVVVYNTSGVKVGESLIFNPQTATKVDVSIDNKPPVVVPPKPPTEYMSISLNISGKCSNKNVEAPFNSWVTLKNLTNNTSTVFYVKNSVIDNPTKSIQVIVGHEYKFTVTYNGKVETSDIYKAEKKEADFKFTNQFEGKSTYDAASKTMTMSGVVLQDCN